ncbi:hypothetical protein FBU30_008990 [Linnemannia zychae]|nr:hypothetical protein FBU30_008990 [Linnemannia zychae]
MTITYTPSPITVKFLRPKCFCGYTSVAIYPDPSATSQGNVRGITVDSPLRNNWVYECHFTPEQRGMVKPDICKDCEDARQSHGSSESKQSSSTSLSIRQDKSKLTEGLNTEQRQHNQHTPSLYDNVELWPRPTVPLSSLHDSQTDNSNESITGAQISYPTAFHGLSPLDHLRVCGFHMHALEWHHMQTLGTNQILLLARQTGCGVFNVSVVRWLGEHIRKRPPLASNTNETIRSIACKAKDKDMSAEIIADMELRLFHRMGCLCKKEVALVLAPPPTKALVANRQNTPITTLQERQFWLVCRARAESKPSFEIVDNGGYSGGGYKSMLGFYTAATATASGPSGGGKLISTSTTGLGMGLNVQICSFGIPLEIANFGYNWAPIHRQIIMNDWQAQWLLPPPMPQSIPPPLQPPLSQGQYMMMQCQEQKEKPWFMPFKYNDGVIQRLKNGRRHNDYDCYNKDRHTHWNTGFHPIHQGPGMERHESNLQELDMKLQKVLAQHVAILKSKIGIDENSQSLNMQDDRVCSQFYKQIDMDAISAVSLQLCDACRDSNKEFCVIPRYHKDNHLTSCSKEEFSGQLSQVHMDTNIGTDLYTDMDKDVKPEIEADPELRHIDKELERIMERHSEQALRVMEIRSRLIPFFLQCESCRLRWMDVDVVPCSHIFLCIQCLEHVEFYVVPRQGKQKQRLSKDMK